MICDNLTINEKGHLTFACVDTIDIVKKYGSPLYVLDEDRIRNNCRRYINAFDKYFPNGSKVLYASKANCFKQMYRIISQEKLGIDVVSIGEIYTAFKAGFDLSNAYFHGNNKTDEDIRFALDHQVGYFVVDNEEELDSLNRIAEEKGVIQKILIRITPGIDPHTYEEVSTGQVDSKFGNAIITGQAEKIVSMALNMRNIDLVGLHCHVGSQVFEEDVHEKSMKVLLEFTSELKRKYNYELRELNIGGGFGVRYVEEDPYINIEEKIKELAELFHHTCKQLGLNEPVFIMEPGRSIIADCGITLYKVGSLKKIEGYKNYVSIDGGMTDNPRYALYKSKYTCLCANKMNEENNLKCNLVGRCCESGDIIQRDIYLPLSIKRDDVIAVCITGAYNYSMSSNYNRLPKPATVMIKDQKPYLVVKRESLDDMMKNEL